MSREMKLVAYILGGLVAARLLILVIDGIAESVERASLES